MSNNTYLDVKCCTENEVSFSLYDAVNNLHSLSYGNCEQENGTRNGRV